MIPPGAHPQSSGKGWDDSDWAANKEQSSLSRGSRGQRCGSGWDCHPLPLTCRPSNTSSTALGCTRELSAALAARISPSQLAGPA